MSTFTFRVTSSATNTAGSAYGQQPDLGTPSFLDLYISGSTDPLVPNGQYDAYCLNPLININLSPTTYSAENLAGNTAASFVPIGFSSMSQTQVDQINWLLSQNFTSDAKYGGQYNFGEVQTAIWKLVGFTNAQISGAGLDLFINDNGRNVVSASDISFLTSAAQSAVASGNGVLPTDAFFSTIIDPAGNVQPLIVQLQSAKLGNFVWSDTNGNGLQDSGEAGVDKVVVELYDTAGKLIASTITGDDYSTAAVEHGFYQFAGLHAGDYQVKFIAPAYNFTTANANGNSQDTLDSDADALTGLSHVVRLAAGQSNQTLDAGLVAKPANASVSGYVYEDFGNDGVRGAGEPALAGVTITLTGVDNLGHAVSASTVTDAAGFYAFTGLAAGTYTVTESQPGAYLDGKDTAGSNGGSTAVNDVISNVVLAAGDNSVNNNFGELVGAQIRGTVFCDDNNDGTQQAGEVGLGGVTVNLSGMNDRGIAVSASTVTAADGSYIFVGLRPGTYSVTEPTQPAGKLDGIDSAGLNGGGTAGNDVISNITLTQGFISDNNNFGEIKPAGITGVVFADSNNDGIQGAGELGIPGATVSLTGTDDRGQAVTATTTTAADGSYKFADLRPGNYTVSETQPAGYLDGKDTVGSSGGVLADDKISAIVLGAGVTSSGNNFAELKAACILGTVFDDKNNDGVQGAGEVGIAGATVTVTGTNDLGQAVTATLLTDANGNYKFVDLRPGTYTVTESQPAGYLDGKDSAGNSGGAVTNDKVSGIVLNPGDAPTGVNFGELKTGAAITGCVFEDSNNDGIKGAGELGIPGATVTLTGTNDLGQPVSATTTTAADGSYAFNGLRPGNYTVNETQPAGYLDGKDSAGSAGGTVSNDQIASITLPAGVTSVNNNFGELKPACILGAVFEDKNGDGIRGAGETGILGATVTLSGTNDLGQAVTATLLTDANGNYKFVDLRPGTYTVTESQPAGYLDGKDSAGNSGGVLGNDKVSTITLNPGDAPSGVNFGELKAACILGTVFEDKNNDGVQGAGETGIAGATVTLTGTNDLGVAVSVSATTAADGSYKFADLRPGNYTVSETQPVGYLDGKDTVGSGGGVLANDKISSIVLASGDVSSGNNFAELKAACILGTVFDDKNNDGVQGAGEVGIAGATVTVTGTNDLGQAVTATLLTDANGNYKFVDLRPGTYTVTESQPAGYLDGKDSAGNSGGVLGNDKVSTITLNPGDAPSGVNFGELKAASIAGCVYNDVNNDGLKGAGEGGIAGATVTLTGTNDLGVAVSVSATTAADGSYAFTGLRPGSYSVTETQPAGYADGKDTAGSAGGTVSNDKISAITLGAGVDSINNNFGELTPAKAHIGDLVFEDKNANGTQDAGEVGIGNVTVNLCDANGNVVGSTTTDAAGKYGFDVAAGTYSVQVVAPANYLVSAKDVGGNSAASDAVDSDIGANGKTGNYVLAAGDVNNTVDAGLYRSASLGDKVWLDANRNGIQDAGEAGKAGVTVNLCNAAGVVVASQTTDVNGKYLFTNLTPGAYSVQFVAPTGYGLTVKDANNNGSDSTDSDADQTSGKTTLYSLNSGDSNLTVDAGLVTCQVKLGDRVWIDTNNNGVQDAGEKGLAGVKVALIGAGADGTLGTADDTSRSTTTDANGLYLFDQVEFGTYKIRFDAGTNYVATKANIGDDALDSDVVATLTKGSTNLVCNGSFESGTTGWTGSGDEVEVNTATSYGVTGATGAKVAELDANSCGTTGFYQVIQTTAKQTYELSVDIAARAGTALATSTVEVYWAGSKIATIDPTSTAMKTYSFTVTGTGGADKLEFRGQAGDDDGKGGIIDNVKLVTCTTVTETAPIIVNACSDNLTIDAGLVGNFKPGIDVEKYVSSTLTTTPTNNGGQGADCSYWKSNCATTSTNNWVATGKHSGYWETTTTPNGWSGIAGITGKESFNSVFGVNSAAGTKSVYEVLGSTGSSSQDKLMRECVAAYLNASHGKVDYAYSKEQVVAESKYAIESGKFDEVSKAFAKENDLGSSFSATKTTYSSVVDTQLYDADAPPGLEVKAGSTVTFTYIVKNTGDTALKNVLLTDDRIADVKYVSGDSNANGLLDTTETWTYTAKEVASSGTIKNTGTVTAVDAVTGSQAVTDKDDAYYTGKGTVATKGSIGDKVFEDKNFNGLQDAGEGGVAGIKVTLKGAGVDGVFGTRDDISATTTTLANGAYAFNDLTAGKYQVVFADTSGKGYLATKANQGADDSKDSDIDASGATGVITLAAGEHNLTVDAGVYLKACVGDKVWEDKNHNNVQDVGEIGIGGIKVALRDAAGTVLYTTTTNAAGNYQFSNVDPGSYYLQFDKSNVLHNASYGGTFNMNNWAWGVKDVGSNDAIDSDVKGDANATTNVSKTDLFTLTSGQSDQTRDAAITPIVIDLDGNGIHTIARSDSAGSFDLFGNGAAVKSGWISSGDGFLAVDINGNGKIDGISELFGGNAKGAGFANLASYDSNHDGVVNSLDADFGKLMIWQDANGNHSTDAGELRTLAQAGVASLTVAYTELPFIDAQGNMHLERSSATLDSGASVDMTDVYFNVDAADAKAAGVALPTMADLLGDDRAMDVVVGGSDMVSTCQVKHADEAGSANGGDAGEVMRRLAALTREDHHAAAA